MRFADEPWVFDHLGLLVKNLAKGRAILTSMFDIREWTDEIVDAGNGVRIHFGRDPAGVVYELLEPLDEDSPVYPALKSAKAILNHVAYRTRDIDAAGARLRKAGCAPVSPPRPAIAYGGRPIQFFVSPLRLIVELIEAPDHAHAYLRQA